jgi:RNA polymerase sigma factor (sigma-70 family)
MRNPNWVNPIELKIRGLIAQRNFEKAFETSRLAYEREIKDYCINRLRGYVPDHKADGEELAQDIFYEFSRALDDKNNSKKGKYDPNITSVRTFLYIIMMRRIIDKRRAIKRSSLHRDVVRHELNLRASLGPDSHNPETILLAQERKKILDRNIDRLNSLDKVIINLYRHGFTTAEIAQFTGETEETIRTRLPRARDKLVTRDKRSTRDELGMVFQVRDEIDDEVVLQHFETYLSTSTVRYGIGHYYRRVARCFREYIGALCMRK